MTSYIASRWVKATFLGLLGVIILIYAENFVEDLRNALSDSVQFTWTWDLLRILLWVLVAWLFVDAILTVALSLTEQRFSPSDLMRKLEELEKKVEARPRPVRSPEPRTEMVVPALQEEEPPPP